MTHSVITGQLASAVADAGTFTVAYPTGKNEGHFYLAMEHKLIMAGTKYSFPADFDITIDATQITVTNESGATWPAGSDWRLQMNEQGERQNVRETRDRNKSALLPVAYPRLVNSVIKGALSFINLGAPDVADPNGIVAQGTATTTVTAGTIILGTLDVARTLSAQGSSGSDHVITVTGTDDYGFAMVETLTLSGTTKIWGNKAFKTITSVSAAVGASGDTYDLGYEDHIGLPGFMPAAGHVLNCIQDGVLRPKQEVVGPVFIDQTGLLAGTSYWGISEWGGFIERMSTIVETAVTTGGSLTCEIATVAVTGLTVVVADSSAVGDIDTDVPTTLNGKVAPTNQVAPRAAVEFVGDAAFATAGALEEHCIVNTTGIIAAGLRAAEGSTATSADVRGTFMPPVPCDGTIVWQLLVCLPDPGYIGIAQYAG